MTPDKARELLDTPQPDPNDPSWDYGPLSPRDSAMLEASDDMARTIVAVGGVLDHLEASANHKQETKASAYGDGYVDALAIAVRELREALGIDDNRG